VLTETYADCGVIEGAEQAFNLLDNMWHLIAAATVLARYEDAADAWPSLPERMTDLEALAGEIPMEARCSALVQLARVWLHLEQARRAMACLRSAAEAHGTLAEPDLEVSAALISELRAAGADDLRTAIVSQTTEAALGSIHYPPPGHGLTFNTKAQEAARMLASVGEPDAAMRVARSLMPEDRPGALELVVAAFAAAGRWDEANALNAEIEASWQPESFAVVFSADPPLDDASQADRGWYRIASELAAEGEQEPALDAAHRIQSTVARCAALAVIARHYAEADQPDAAVEMLTEHDRDLRLHAADEGRLIAVPAAIRMLVAARAWPAAMRMFDTVQHGMGVFAWQGLTTLADGLLIDGERDLARQVIDELDPDLRVTLLIRWAEGADPDTRTAALAQAEEIAEQIDDPEGHASAVRAVFRACVDREPDRAATLLRRAIASLNQIERFGYRPTPWTNVASDLVLVGDPDAALDLASRLPPDDAAVALCEIAETAHRIGAVIDSARTIDSAAEIAATIDASSVQLQWVVPRVALAYAKIGMLDRAIAVAAANGAAQRAIAAHLARSGHPNDALRILGDDLGHEHRDMDAEEAIVTALLTAGDYAEAAHVARAVREPGVRAGLLARTARALAPRQPAEARQFAMDALSLLPDLNQFHVQWIEELAAALAETGEPATLLETIRRE
jgi:hypothetical protein